jgi:hypothetical protein
VVSPILAGCKPLFESRESEMALGNRICGINQMNELSTVRSPCNQMRCEAAATALDCVEVLVIASQQRILPDQRGKFHDFIHLRAHSNAIDWAPRDTDCHSRRSAVKVMLACESTARESTVHKVLHESTCMKVLRLQSLAKSASSSFAYRLADNRLIGLSDNSAIS